MAEVFLCVGVCLIGIGMIMTLTLPIILNITVRSDTEIPTIIVAGFIIFLIGIFVTLVSGIWIWISPYM